MLKAFLNFRSATRRQITVLTLAAMSLVVAGSVAHSQSSVTSSDNLAEELIGSYVAYIGRADLYNSKGAKLSEPWQVIRQDRANYHRFGKSQPGDEWDPFFDSVANRAAMEKMIRRGYIEPRAERMLLKGDVLIYVEIFGHNGKGNSIQVDVRQ